jgi:hypothetical protein
MSTPPSIMGLFCEHALQDVQHAVTIIGAMPDNANVPPISGEGTAFIPRLSLYLRMNFDPHAKPENVSVKMVLPDGREEALQVLEESAIIKAAESALEQGSPLAGVYSIITMSPFPIMVGRVQVNVAANGQEYIAAILNLHTKDQPPPSPSTASPPLSEQSQSAVS